MRYHGGCHRVTEAYVSYSDADDSSSDGDVETFSGKDNQPHPPPPPQAAGTVAVARGVRVALHF